MPDFITVDQPTDSPPRSQMRRREVPYYHRHTVHRSTWIDWLALTAVVAVGLCCIAAFGGAPQ